MRASLGIRVVVIVVIHLCHCLLLSLFSALSFNIFVDTRHHCLSSLTLLSFIERCYWGSSFIVVDIIVFSWRCSHLLHRHCYYPNFVIVVDIAFDHCFIFNFCLCHCRYGWSFIFFTLSIDVVVVFFVVVDVEVFCRCGCSVISPALESRMTPCRSPLMDDLRRGLRPHLTAIIFRAHVTEIEKEKLRGKRDWKIKRNKRDIERGSRGLKKSET